ncbi:MAG: hypothetical protein ACYDC1_22595 [Limisphaerales bacterium]
MITHEPSVIKPTSGMAFTKALEALARKHAPKPIVKIGELVMTNWCGRGAQDRMTSPLTGKLRQVMISVIGIHLCATGERFNQQPIFPQIYYLALRCARDGKPKSGLCMILISNLRKADGTEWVEINDSFNHYGFSWEIERMPWDV